MKKIIVAMFALGIVTALPAHAQPGGGLAIEKPAQPSAITKVDWDDWHSRWRSHYRWGSHGEWGGSWGWHNRWRSHYRWGSNGGWGDGHWRWGSGRRWWR